jgi:hypothetical protein
VTLIILSVVLEENWTDNFPVSFKAFKKVELKEANAPDFYGLRIFPDSFF